MCAFTLASQDSGSEAAASMCGVLPRARAVHGECTVCDLLYLRWHSASDEVGRAVLYGLPHAEYAASGRGGFRARDRAGRVIDSVEHPWGCSTRDFGWRSASSAGIKLHERWAA